MKNQRPNAGTLFLFEPGIFAYFRDQGKISAGNPCVLTQHPRMEEYLYCPSKYYGNERFRNTDESKRSGTVHYLKKNPAKFTKGDIIRFCEKNAIEMINFRYLTGDWKLKTLNFVISSKGYLDTILSDGERVDGSNIFTFIEAGSSDLYVVPQYSTAFVNPFADVPTLDILCSYYDNTGRSLASSPKYILRSAPVMRSDGAQV